MTNLDFSTGRWAAYTGIYVTLKAPYISEILKETPKNLRVLEPMRGYAPQEALIDKGKVFATFPTEGAAKAHVEKCAAVFEAKHQAAMDDFRSARLRLDEINGEWLRRLSDTPQERDDGTDN